MRPFQGAPKIIDMTADTPYEHDWIPIMPAKGRREMDIDEKYDHIYDRRQVDYGLFEGF